MNEGYWGPRTASVDWCEPNYVYTKYIAEFWNTLSSLAMVASGIYGTRNAWKYRYQPQFWVPSFLMIFVGLGSIWFHGTLQYPGQVLDELSMVYCVSSYLYLVLETEAHTKRPWLPAALLIYNAAFTAVYILLPAYFAFFVLTFIALCVIVVAKSIALYRDTVDTRLKPLFWVFAGVFLVAFLFFWIPDQVFCTSLQHLNLHAMFHVLSAISTYWFGVYIVQRFYEDRWAEKRGWSAVLGREGATPKAGKWGALHDARMGAAAAGRTAEVPLLQQLGRRSAEAAAGRQLGGSTGGGNNKAATNGCSPHSGRSVPSLRLNINTTPSPATERDADSTAAMGSSSNHSCQGPSLMNDDSQQQPQPVLARTPSPRTRLNAMREDARACDAHAVAMRGYGEIDGSPVTAAATAVWSGLVGLLSPSSMTASAIKRSGSGRQLMAASGRARATSFGSSSSATTAAGAGASGVHAAAVPSKCEAAGSSRESRSSSGHTAASADSTPAQSPRVSSDTAAAAAGSGGGDDGGCVGQGRPPARRSPRSLASHAGGEEYALQQSARSGSSSDRSQRSTDREEGVAAAVAATRLDSGFFREQQAPPRPASRPPRNPRRGGPAPSASSASSEAMAAHSHPTLFIDPGAAAAAGGAAALGGRGAPSLEHTIVDTNNVMVVPELVLATRDSWVSWIAPHVRLTRKLAYE